MLDLNTGLTQVLDENAPQEYGAYSYTYGLGCISQQAGSTAEYFLLFCTNNRSAKDFP